MSAKGKKGNNGTPKKEEVKPVETKVEATPVAATPSPKKGGKKAETKVEAAPVETATPSPKKGGKNTKAEPKAEPKVEAAPVVEAAPSPKKGGKKGGKQQAAEAPKAEPKVEAAPVVEATPSPKKGGKKGKQEQPKEEPKKEEPKAVVQEEVESEDEEMPELTDASNVVGEGEEQSGESKQSRHEKKARKAFQKLGMKPVDGIRKVTVKKSDKVLFVVNKPEVHKSNNSETYVVFGEVKMEDMTNSALSNAARQFSDKPADGEPTTEEPTQEEEGEEEVPELVAAPETTTKKNAGFSDADINSVKSQANVDEEAAVKALEANKGDVLKAIMSLNSSTKKEKKQKKK